MESLPLNSLVSLNSDLLQEGNIQANNTCPVFFGAVGTLVPVFNMCVRPVGLINVLKHLAISRVKPIHRVISYHPCQFLSPLFWSWNRGWCVGFPWLESRLLDRGSSLLQTEKESTAWPLAHTEEWHYQHQILKNFFVTKNQWVCARVESAFPMEII